MEINYKILPCFSKVHLTEVPCYRDQRYQSYQLCNKSHTTEYAVSLFFHFWPRKCGICQQLSHSDVPQLGHGCF